ncbi:BglG family transcription antiterminator [Thermoactinomyces sp. AMNI-1]|uniref:Ascorbate-specific PTS system EIIA component n=1 Tax=Thermoactinomyces mirandus TaxID=2756294 RepID=A0A7W2ASY3_9BACL|nr:BglG family transcription antiterminator [Thermoactinomyces mirandus]
MGLNKRCKVILDELLSNPSITSMDLERKHHLTKRQIGYSLDKINEWLMTNNLPVIERTRRGQFVIDQAVFSKFNLLDDADSFPVNTNILTEAQRVNLIIMILLSSEEELSLNHFTYHLDVSKNTVLSDLKRVQNYLDGYGLTIRYSRRKGYVIEGKEFQIRKLLIHVTGQVLQFSHGENQLRKITGIQDEEIRKFKNRIDRVEDILNSRFTDEKLKVMPYIFILILKRIRKGNIIDSFPIEYDELSNTTEYQATEEILHGYKDIPVTERLFVTLHLLTTNVFSTFFTDETIPDLIPAIDKMLRQFEKNACIYLENRDELMDKLLQHIKPAYYRIKYQLTDNIQFKGSFSKEFQELHHLVRRSTGPLQELIGSDIPENETAYIAMLIGGWMNRQGKSIDKKVKAVVVCPQGISVSKLLFKELKELFPEFVFLDYLSVREFMNYHLDYDLVFSPTYLETDKKLFVTKVFLGKEEKYRLRKQVMLGVYGYIPNHINIDHIMDIVSNYTNIQDEKALKNELEKYINRDENSAVVNQTIHDSDLQLNQLIISKNITLADTVESWDSAIRLSAEPLVKSGIIEPDYVDAMIRYSKQDSYIVIGPNMAIPHAAPEDGVNEVGMSLLRVKEGIHYVNKYKIHLVIVIAAKDKYQHIHALMQLMKLAGSDEDRNQLINADSVEEISEIINLYSVD